MKSSKTLQTKDSSNTQKSDSTSSHFSFVGTSVPIAKAGLTFDEKAHEYYFDGRNVPGISKILKKLGLTKSYAGVNDYYRQRGVFAHEAIELDLQGDLDFDTLDPALKPFVTAWRAFVAKHGYKAILTERMLYSPTEDYACRLDHFGIVDDLLTVFDVKCTNSSDPGADWQVCGQAFVVAENYVIPQRQAVLELHGDGTFEPIFSPVDLEIWPAVMKLFRRKNA